MYTRTQIHIHIDYRIFRAGLVSIAHALNVSNNGRKRARYCRRDCVTLLAARIIAFFHNSYTLIKSCSYWPVACRLMKYLYFVRYNAQNRRWKSLEVVTGNLVTYRYYIVYNVYLEEDINFS